jgi:hypothetical protein
MLNYLIKALYAGLIAFQARICHLDPTGMPVGHVRETLIDTVSVFYNQQTGGILCRTVSGGVYSHSPAAARLRRPGTLIARLFSAGRIAQKLGHAAIHLVDRAVDEGSANRSKYLLNRI